MEERETKMARVVHCRREQYDVYIGRGICPVTGRLGDWGNPFTLKRHGLQAIILFVDMLAELREEELIRLVRSLRGKVLGCWCAPRACHGDVLARLANGHPIAMVRAWAEQVVADATKPVQLGLFRVA